MRSYFIATFDARIRDQWHLGSPLDGGGTELRGGLFTMGRSYQGARPATIPIYQTGRPVEVTFGDEKMVVVSQTAKQAVERVAAKDCQFIPVSIPGMNAPWFILNAIALVNCFDESRSIYEAGASNSPQSPDYDAVARLIVDPARIGNHQLFRVQGWDVDLIVSDTVKSAIEAISNHGVLFKQVTP
jgi:hypothetical protein